MESRPKSRQGQFWDLRPDRFALKMSQNFHHAPGLSAPMNLLFPDRAKLERDPLGFLLLKAERASSPILPLALGFRRNLLLADLSLINEGPFCADRLYVPPSTPDFFAPVAIDETFLKLQTARPLIGMSGERFTKIIAGLTKEVLCGFRRDIFSAYRHASFDCWNFSNSVAAKLTFTSLFGKDCVADQQLFSHHAEIIHSLKDLISLELLLRRSKPMRLKMQSFKHSLHIAHSETRKAHRNTNEKSLFYYARDEIH
jgi:hypothetical protein